eukprot:g4839.t1
MAMSGLISREDQLRLNASKAISKGDIDNPVIVQAFAEGVIPPDFETEDEGKTALFCATERQNTDAIRKFLEAGAAVDHETSTGEVALAEACRIGNIDIISTLMTAGADVNRKNCNGESPLLHAIRCAETPDVVRWLLESAGALPDSQCFVEATSQGRHQILLLMIGMNSEIAGLINEADPMTGQTALTCACEAGQSGTAILLVDNGAHLEIETIQGHTALTQASYFGHVDVQQFLLSRGAVVDHETRGGFTALLQCCVSGTVESARLLLEAEPLPADPNYQSKSFLTPLTVAARCGHADIISALLARGARINFETRSGRTPLIEAVKYNQIEATRRLLADHALEINQITRSENMPSATALIEGARSGSLECVELLLSSPRTDVYKETGDEYCATNSAIDAGDAIMLRKLIRHMIEKTIDEKKPKEVLSRKLVITHLRDAKKLADQRRKGISYKEQMKKQRAEAVYDELQAGILENRNAIAVLLEHIGGSQAEKEREAAIIQLESRSASNHAQIISEHVSIEHKKEVILNIKMNNE